MKEYWKTIKFGNGRYSVSTKGNVRNNETGKLICGDINNFGYYRVQLWYHGHKKRYMRHRLVAKYFIKRNDRDKKFVNHIDGDKSNNCVENLEWVTQSENEKHAFRTGLKKRTNKKIMVEFNSEIIFIYDNQYAIAKDLKCNQSQVSNWILHKSKIPKKYNITKMKFIS